MSAPHDAHDGAGHHAGPDPAKWMIENMGGIIMPVGERLEKLIDRFMYAIVNDLFRRLVIIYMVIFTPVLLIQFLLRYVGM